MLEAPQWLSRRGGALQKGHAGNAWFVVFDNQPHYRLVAVPVTGKYGCDITQTENGKRIASASQASSSEAAIASGLEELGKVLGWN